MLSRATLFMVIVLFGSSLPLSANRNGKRQSSQNPSLEIFTSHVFAPHDRINLRLTGSYRKAAQTVHLHAITVRDRRRSKIAHGRDKAIQSPPMSKTSSVKAVYHFTGAPQNPAPIEGGDPGYEYYYTQGEMTKSDGTVLVTSDYQYDSATSQNIFNISLGGVSFSFDLNTQEQISPVSDADVEQVQAWLNSSDGQLVRETGIALIQQGQQQPDNESLLIYYLVALTVGDDATTQAIFRISDQREESIRTHHASRLVESTLKTASCEDALFANKEILLKTLLPTMVVQCSGGCGAGCYVIPTKWGVPIYGWPCSNHDQCVRNHGGWRFHPACWGKGAVAIAYVIYRW